MNGEDYSIEVKAERIFNLLVKATAQMETDVIVIVEEDE